MTHLFRMTSGAESANGYGCSGRLRFFLAWCLVIVALPGPFHGLVVADGGDVWAGYRPPVFHEPYATLDRLEDVRLLYTLTAYRVHQLDTLLRYGQGFEVAGLNSDEAQHWHLRALRLFEYLKSVDDGGQAWAALADYHRREGHVAPDPDALQRAIGGAADRTLAFYRALALRIADVREQVETASAEAGFSPPVSVPGRMWEHPARETGRRMGFMPAWYLWMNHRADSPHAALDRQQGLDAELLLYKAKKLGIRAVLPEFHGHQNEEAVSWRVVEAREGHYDFSRIDRNIAQIAGHGMKTIVPIRSLNTLPPAWAEARFGEHARLYAYQAGGAPKPTMGVNIFDVPTQRAFLAYLDALLSHLAQTQRENIAAIALEVSMMALPMDVDYSPVARAHFSTWMEARYDGDLAELNRLWMSDYETFADVEIPEPRREPPELPDVETAPEDLLLSAGARWHDWLAWRKAWIAEYFAMQADLVRRHFPHIPIQAFSISANSHHAHSERPVASWPLRAMGEIADLPSSAATSEPIHALLRAVGGGRFAGQQAEQNFGAMLGGAAYTAFLKDTLYTIARNGPEMILRYFYSPDLYPYMDRQAGWDGAYSFRLKMNEMHRLAPMIENTRPVPGNVAVLWSTASYDRDPTRYSRYGVLGTAYALMSAKIQYDIVLDTALSEKKLSDYAIVVVPEQRFLSGDTLLALRRYVADGGTLYATGVPGMFDPRGRRRTGEEMRPILEELFGVRIKRFTPAQAVLGTFLTPTRPHAVWDERERGARWHTRGHIFSPDEWTLHGQLSASFEPLEGAEVIYRFADGDAAMVRNRFGAGMTVLFGYPFGHEFAFANTTEMSFGKIYPHYAYPAQMVNLHRWLGRFFRDELHLAQRVQVPLSRMMRFTGSEASGPTMTYPGMGERFEHKRDHTAGPNHSFNIGFRQREEMDTFFLTVFNRDSAYAYGRGYMHYMASPTYGVIRLNRTDVTAVYDVVNDVYVPFVKGDRSLPPNRDGSYPQSDRCISFEAVLPSYFGRVYALTTHGGTVELFQDQRDGGIPEALLVERVAAIAAPWSMPDVLVLEEETLRQWLANLSTEGEVRPVYISYGSIHYEAAAERLADALRKQGMAVHASPLDLQHRSPNPDPYYSHRGQRYTRPFEHIDIFIGNEHSNSSLADLTAAWQATRSARPRQILSVNEVFPGGDRAVLQLTIPFSPERGRGDRYPDAYYDFKPHRREVIIGASSPDGALRGVEHVLALWGI